MFLFNKKEDVVLLISINNGGINVSFVSFSENQKPKFLYNTILPLIGEKPEVSNLSSGLSSLLDSSLKEIFKRGWSKAKIKNKEISRVIVSVSSPWFALKVKDIKLSQQIPFIITQDFIDDIVLKEGELFKKELSRNPDNSKIQFSIVEKNIVHTKINGYVVDNIIGKKTKNFDAHLLISTVPKNVKEKIINLVHRHTHLSEEKILMHSFPIILFFVVRDISQPDSDFVMINADSEITDVILVKDHVIKSIVSFSFGKNTIIRHLAKFFKISPEIAESQFNMYVFGKIDKPTANSIENILENLEREWAVYLEDALLSLSSGAFLPKKTYIISDGPFSSILINFLKLQKTDMTSSFRKNINITHIDSSFLSSLCQSNSGMLFFMINFSKINKMGLRIYIKVRKMK